MMDSWTRRLSGATLAVVLGTATAWADASALEKFAGAKDAIMGYYAANAREGGGNCGAGNMSDIGGATVVSESADQAVVKVDYTFSATATGGNTGLCSGPASREFTLAKGGSGWTVSGMTGEAP
jgi:hypothetical protein